MLKVPVHFSVEFVVEMEKSSFVFFYAFPSYIFWGSPLLGEIFAYVTVF